MTKLFLLFTLLFLTILGVAQNRTIIKGKITDSISKAPIEFATVAILNAHDTTAASLISYAQTDRDGLFTLQNLPVGKPLKVVISFVGYRSYIKFFALVKGQILNMAMVQLSPKQLNEVVIKGERMPITLSKDTVEFDASAFKTRPNAMVEDLLKKLPGVEVDNQGKITFMGKSITKILIDGREFFTNDPRIASKNLDADLIAKVQVYDDREDDPNHVIPDNEVKKIINLKFKKALKKSIFGKVYAGQGTRDHYQSGGLFNMFRDTLQVSLLAFNNNLNSTGFDYNDIYSNAGGNRGAGAFSGLGSPSGRIGDGRQTATTGGININTDYGKKLKINLSYLYQHTNTGFNTINNRQQFLSDTVATTNSTSDRTNIADSHRIVGSVFWKPSDATQLKYNPTVDIRQNSADNNYSSNSFSNFINPINNSVSGGNSLNNSFQFQQSLNYNHKLKKEGSAISIDHSFSFSPGNNGNSFSNQSLTSYIANFPSYTLKRFGDNESRGTNGNATFTYRNKLSKKLSVDIAAGTEFGHQLDKASSYDYNPVTGEYDSLLLSLSNDLTRNRWAETINPGVTYNFTKNSSLIVHLTSQWQQVNNVFQRNVPDINQNFFYVLPTVNFHINNISLSYARNVQLPGISDMIPYSIVYSPQYTITGNPNLKPTLSDRFTVSYNKYDYQSGTNYYMYGSYSLEQNSVIRQRTVNSQLAETSMPINSDGRNSFSFTSLYSKRLKKHNNLQFNAISMLSFNHNHDFFTINHQDGFQNRYTTSLMQSFWLNWKDIIQLEPQYTISHNYSTYSGIGYNNQSVLTQYAQMHFVLYFIKRYNLEGNYNYKYNPQVPPGYQKTSTLLSLNLAHQFLKKDRGEIKLSCFDILNQNISTSRYVYENYVVDNQSQIVKRYFMLTLQFKFNKATLKK